MSEPTRAALRPVLLAAVRQLIDDARSARASVDLHHKDRPFYLGVEAAAEELLHPELREVRAGAWLDGNPASFRDGYLRTRADLAAAMTATTPPTRLRLPEPDPR